MIKGGLSALLTEMATSSRKKTEARMLSLMSTSEINSHKRSSGSLASGCCSADDLQG